jgi:hypothetical protein
MGGNFRLDVLLGRSGLRRRGGGGAGGVAALRAAARPQELLLAASPLLLALHQLTEGVVWLGLRGARRSLVGRHLLGVGAAALAVACP